MNFIFKEELDTIEKMKEYVRKNGLKRKVLEDVKFIILHKNNINKDDYSEFDVYSGNHYKKNLYYYVSYNYTREKYTFEDLTCSQIDKCNIYYVMGDNI